MDRKFRLTNLLTNNVVSSHINLRCPACHVLGTFESFNNISDIQVTSQGDFQGKVHIGYRICPNRLCKLLIFVAYQQTNQQTLLVSYPFERIDFDASNIPQPIVNVFEEAISCHAIGCYIAAAIMIRKTLEELCANKNANGKNLKEKITALQSTIVIPQDLLAGIDNLRLLGNDAAHIELKDFDKIGQEEVEVSIEFTKEILKAVYQHSLLISRLEALKKKTLP